MQSNRGFTLVELIIAVAIVAIVASIAVPNYRNYVQKSIVSAGVQLAIEPQIEVADKVRRGVAMPALSSRFYEDDSDEAMVSYLHWYSDSTYGGRIVINYGPGAGPALENKRLWIVLDPSNPQVPKWTCMNFPTASLALPTGALPDKCR